MKERDKIIVLFAVIFAVLTMIVKPPELFILNVSPSTPRGIYRVSFSLPEAGDYIVIDSSYVSFTIMETRFLKKIAYANNEEVTIDNDFLMVNNAYFPKYRNMGIDYRGRLGDDECIILGDHPKSFDSRYFGPVKRADCTRVVPLLLFDDRP